ncbi:hypothetical protein M5D96_012749 [Drosophila gunungcola]|uniref:DNA-directed RNA polymerase III subunit RPC9 n=1 Tax=Drosophila gunungcola TaxID=103775 RepID=A0A9Q0BK12_9MUSC|nr:hypothetical protein M5D96_012749 [Drosophila gunungcola]
MLRINPTFSYLTNLEVMQILQKIKSTKKKFGMRNLATVTYEALQYLEESPCKTQSRENIVNYVKDLSSYRLKSHEILQMINDPPTSALHTQLLIDDNKAPLTDEENEKIIQLSYKHFHGAESKEATKETPVEKPAEATAKTAGKQSGKRAGQAKEAEKTSSRSAKRLRRRLRRLTSAELSEEKCPGRHQQHQMGRKGAPLWAWGLLLIICTGLGLCLQLNDDLLESYRIQYHSIIIALVGSSGVGKSQTAQVMHDYFPWSENVKTLSWRGSRSVHRVQSMLGHLALCGQNLILIDNMIPADGQGRMEIANSTKQPHLIQLTMVLIFSINRQQAEDVFEAELETLKQLPRTHVITYAALEPIHLFDCISREAKIEEVQLTDEHVADDLETLFFSGDIKVLIKVPSGPIAMQVDMFRWKRSQWLPTPLSLKRDSLCRALSNPTEIWYPVYRKVPKDQMICPPKKGHIYTLNNVSNHAFVNNMPRLDIAGDLKAVFQLSSGNLKTCAAVFFKVYAK